MCPPETAIAKGAGHGSVEKIIAVEQVGEPGRWADTSVRPYAK